MKVRFFLPAPNYIHHVLDGFGSAADNRIHVVRLYSGVPESLSRNLEGHKPIPVKEKMRGGPMWFETHREQPLLYWNLAQKVRAGFL